LGCSTKHTVVEFPYISTITHDTSIGGEIPYLTIFGPCRLHTSFVSRVEEKRTKAGETGLDGYAEVAALVWYQLTALLLY